ncbi:hypothetical protein CJ014_08995 [Pleomorphomonas carboxyditropha]|uniref:Uncharacterized protein n=1 Tax=Pleomorphomonas carboxyditropha TaxID=2023338 RepID=A0A2G9WXM9_9HYPH|nr:hypothetical protein CJ014_08995 [Pleomorphomonas carboxyditropha]
MDEDMFSPTKECLDSGKTEPFCFGAKAHRRKGDRLPFIAALCLARLDDPFAFAAFSLAILQLIGVAQKLESVKERGAFVGDVNSGLFHRLSSQPVEKRSCNLHSFMDVVDDLLCVRFVFLGICRENANTEFSVFDQESAPVELNWNRPCQFFEAPEIAKSEEICQHEVDKMLCRKLASSIGALSVEEKILIGLGILRRRFDWAKRATCRLADGFEFRREVGAGISWHRKHLHYKGNLWPQ